MNKRCDSERTSIVVGGEERRSAEGCNVCAYTLLNEKKQSMKLYLDTASVKEAKSHERGRGR